MFRFANQYMLYALILIPVIVLIFIITYRLKKRAINKFGNFELIQQLMPYVSFRRPVAKFIMIMLALLFIIIGISRPQFGSKLRKVKRKGVEIIIALDVSNSMMAQDIQPNRLERAKIAMTNLTDKLKNDKIGMIVFAGEAYTQLPITTDYSAAKLFLNTISTDIMPIQGTAIGKAINLARKSFTPETKSNKVIVVITDGENHDEEAIEAAKEAYKEGIVVHTIGMGLDKGVPIPVKGRTNEYMKDAQGNVVTTKLNAVMLSKIAAAGQGEYVIASKTNAGLNKLYDKINSMEKTDIEASVYSEYDEKFPFYIGFGLFLLLLEFIILERKNKRFIKFSLFK